MLLVVTNLNLQHIYILPGKQYIKYMYIHLILIYRHIQIFNSPDHIVLKNKIFKTPNLFTNPPHVICHDF